MAFQHVNSLACEIHWFVSSAFDGRSRVALSVGARHNWVALLFPKQRSRAVCAAWRGVSHESAFE